MRSTVLKQLIAVALLSSTSGILVAQSPPRILRDPLLELKYEQAKIRFEPLPLQAISGCATLSDNEYSVGVHYVFAKTGDTSGKDRTALDEGGNPSRAFFIFASASDASGRVFYLLNGYHVRHHLDDLRFPRYAVDEYAPIIMLQHLACVIIDHEGPDRLADENFTEEYSRDIQQRLMIDYANRLVAAYGGKDKLRIELLNQYVDVDTLPEALRYAFKNLRLTK